MADISERRKELYGRIMSLLNGGDNTIKIYHEYDMNKNTTLINTIREVKEETIQLFKGTRFPRYVKNIGTPKEQDKFYWYYVKGLLREMNIKFFSGESLIARDTEKIRTRTIQLEI